VLAVAGIECLVEPHAGTLAPDVEAVLAWTVREGITNVIRHSRAQRCTIRITRGDRTATVEVTNDGTCGPGENSELRRGSGLAGLTERVTALRGHIEAGPLHTEETQGFRLWVAIPLGHEGADEREGQR
jgi:two-component system, NarL family, sensor histidine kinase DesK